MFSHKFNNYKKIEMLYNKYKFFLYEQAYSVLNDSFMAEDAIHQTFIKIIKNIDKIDDVNSKKTRNFLAVICRNVAIDLYNEKKQNFVTIDEIEIMEDKKQEFVNEIIISNENVKKIRKAINSLPIIYKDIILLERFYCYTQKEIADILGISVENAYKRSIRARNMLMKMLESEEVRDNEKRK